ncbi:D-alanyl-D-alanine carboxypeptidase family protein [Corynebacterium pseudotuberculosis]|uniref:D-alanyl-D-alanine carboxypeptidase family protein n=1 Tax=Corynebacterium pseudotuberculosis TaxID=1719 RepID=UPI0034E96DDB
MKVSSTIAALTASSFTLAFVLTPAALADPTPRSSAPNTNNCEYALTPPPAETTSEQLKPGQTSPTPRPTVINEYRGGCGVTKAKGFNEPANTASAWMVFDLDNGDVIATKDPHGRYRPASVIKALLALVALDELNLKAKVKITAEDANQEGSAVGYVDGVEYTNEQLLYGLLLNSGNDAAHALAQRLGGDNKTLEKVNALAHSLGTVDTYAATPTFQVWNDNGLFLNDEHGIGGKTGYTDDAHHTFVGAKNIDGRRLAAVILDTTVEQGRPWQQAQKLIDAAYAVPRGEKVGNLKETSIPSQPSPSELPTPPTPEEGDAPSRDRNHAPVLVIGGATLGLIVLGILTWFLGRKKHNKKA